MDDIYFWGIVIIVLFFFLGMFGVSLSGDSGEYIRPVNVCSKCKHCKNAIDDDGKPILGCFHPTLANHGFMNVVTGELTGINCINARDGEDSFCGDSGHCYEENEESTINEGEV